MTKKDSFSTGSQSTLLEEDESMAMPKTNRKGALSSLDEPGSVLMDLARRYGVGLLVLLAILGLVSYFFSGPSDGARRQTFITLEVPPPVQSSPANTPSVSTTNQSAPPIPDDQD